MLSGHVPTSEQTLWDMNKVRGQKRKTLLITHDSTVTLTRKGIVKKMRGGGCALHALVSLVCCIPAFQFFISCITTQSDHPHIASLAFSPSVRMEQHKELEPQASSFGWKGGAKFTSTTFPRSMINVEVYECNMYDLSLIYVTEVVKNHNCRLVTDVKYLRTTSCTACVTNDEEHEWVWLDTQSIEQCLFGELDTITNHSLSTCMLIMGTIEYRQEI